MKKEDKWYVLLLDSSYLMGFVFGIVYIRITEIFNVRAIDPLYYAFALTIISLIIVKYKKKIGGK